MKICPVCRVRFGDAQPNCVLCGSKLVPLSALEPDEEEKARPAPARPRRRRKKVGAGRRFLAGLLCALLFLTLLSAALCQMLRRGAEPETAEAAMSGVDLAGLRVDPYFEDVDEPLTVQTLLSEDLQALGLPLDGETVAALLDSAPVRRFIAEQTSGLFRDLIRGEDGAAFDPESLTELLLGDETQRLLGERGVTLGPEEAAQITQLLQRYGLGDFLSRETLERELPDLSRALAACLNDRSFAGLLALLILLVLLILAADRARADLFFGDIGGTLIAAGGLLSLITLTATYLPALWLRICGENAAIAAAGRAFLGQVPVIGLSLFGAGLLLAVTGSLLRR